MKPFTTLWYKPVLCRTISRLLVSPTWRTSMDLDVEREALHRRKESLFLSAGQSRPPCSRAGQRNYLGVFY